ncbi:MAG TPA: MaoC/PaaZ C-terminal domain-containing protein [Solirubrobacteraceae bacterium]|jgi:3-hydroxybutyryl-CoA dehydratase|nr:MaoC/PaaZ C-terminal domain-containing protein [Solirubrobacteraceae bacterium]
MASVSPTPTSKSAALGFPAVGEELSSCPRVVTEADIAMFSALMGDWHPQHTNVEWAGTSRFGERIAHGLRVLSFAVGLLELDRERVIARRRLREVVFKRPTHIGETIRVDALVESVRPVSADCALVGLRWRVVNAREETVLRAGIDVLYRGSVGE